LYSSTEEYRSTRAHSLEHKNLTVYIKAHRTKSKIKDLLGGSLSFGIRRRLTGRSVPTFRNVIFVSGSKVKYSVKHLTLDGVIIIVSRKVANIMQLRCAISLKFKTSTLENRKLKISYRNQEL